MRGCLLLNQRTQSDGMGREAWAWVEADVNEKDNLELGRKNGFC